MSRGIGPLVVRATAFAAAITTSTAQVQFTDTYPFSASHAVVNDPVTHTIYEAAGSGVFVLDGSSTATAEPALKSGVANQLRPEGLVKDLALTSDHLYVAAHRGGLVRYSRTATNPSFQWKLEGPPVPDAWAVVVPVRANGNDLVVVGTNDAFTGGRLHLIHADATTDPAPLPQLHETLDVGAPVHSLAATVQANGTVTLLVGTACGTVSTQGGGPIGETFAGLLRFDFLNATTTLPTTFPVLSASWTAIEQQGSLPTAVPTFVRDIVIDAETQTAYVAAFTKGIRKISLAGTGLLEVIGTGWPIAPTAGLPERFDGLALYRGSLGVLLGAALGPPFADELQQFGTCTALPACAGPGGEDLGAAQGVRLYDVSGTSPLSVGQILRRDCPAPPCLTGSPVKLAIREFGGGLRIDVAATSQGLSVVTAQGSPFSLVANGSWGGRDGVATSAWDDLIQIGTNLIGTDEVSLAIFDLTNPQPLASPVSLLYPSGGAIQLSGFAAETGIEAMVFASAGDNGINFYRFVSPGTPSAALLPLGNVIAPGRALTVQALPPSATPDQTPWIVAAFNQDADTIDGCQSSLPVGGGTVRIWRLNDDDADSVFEPTEASPLGSFVPDLCHPALNGDKAGYWLDCRLPTPVGSTFPAWVSYGPKNLGTVGSVPVVEPNAGVLMLSGTFVPGPVRIEDEVVLSWVGKAPAVLNAPDANAGRVTYLPDQGRLVVALSCNGVAAYSVPSFTQLPTMPSAWSQPGRSFITALGGPSQDFYALDVSGSLLVFDTGSVSAGPLQVIPTRNRAIGLAPAASALPGSPPPPAFYLADGIGGVHKLQFLAIP